MGSADSTVVATFDEPISNPTPSGVNSLHNPSGVYDTPNLVSAAYVAKVGGSTRTWTSPSTVTMHWNDITDSDDLPVLGNDEIRFAPGQIRTVSNGYWNQGIVRAQLVAP